MRMKRKSMLITALLIIIIPAYLYWQNNAIGVSYYNFSDIRIPQDFDGYKIAQVSDLHNKDFGNQLTDKVANENPDLIVVTGDVIDRNRTDIPVAVRALEELLEIAPVYFVSGNHEVASGVYEELKLEMERMGVINLDNDHDTIVINESEIGLIGIEDPLLFHLEDIEEIGSAERLIRGNINQLSDETDSEYTILLSHRAEQIDIYSETSVDLVLTGHAHGGQIRLPLINGLFAPSQGFLPEYTSGVYENNDTQMIVSRGLGNSMFPLRINNRPELVIITLESE